MMSGMEEASWPSPDEKRVRGWFHPHSDVGGFVEHQLLTSPAAPSGGGPSTLNPCAGLSTEGRERFPEKTLHSDLLLSYNTNSASYSIQPMTTLGNKSNKGADLGKHHKNPGCALVPSRTFPSLPQMTKSHRGTSRPLSKSCQSHR